MSANNKSVDSNLTARQLESNSTQAAARRDIVVLDIGGTSIRIGHWRGNQPCNEFNVLETSSLRVDNAQDILSEIIIRYASALELDVTAVVLGLPGMLNKDTDTITHCNNIKQLEGSGLKSRLTEKLRCRVVLEQDIMLQLLGEWRAGAVVDSPSVFGVYYGTGIGAAYLVDGKPKVDSAAGLQAGHIPVMAQGKPCICGNTDCIEAYASGHTLTELAKTHQCAVEQIFCTTGNDELRSELNAFVRYQAYLLATIGTLFVPDSILIGGGIPQMQAYPRDRLISHVQAHLQKPYPAESIRFAWASLGSTSVLHGAMALLETS